jgi:type I restriction enzyme S subunit
MGKHQLKITEMRFVPEDWESGKFGDFIDGFSSGMTPYRGNKEFYKGEFPWITSGELNYNIIKDTSEKITVDAIRKTNLKIIPQNTFLMAITGLEAEGTRGSCAITGIAATTNQSCMALYPKSGVLITEYLYHYYVLHGNELAFKYSQGTKQQSYNAVTAKKLPIAFPKAIAEQQLIVRVLGDADDYIASLESLVAKKHLIKLGAMQDLLTPQKHWEIISFSDAFDFLITASYSRAELSTEKEIGYIHYGDIHTKWNYHLDLKKVSLPTISSDKTKTFSFVKNGDLIMADASEDYLGLGKGVEIKNMSEQKIIAGLHTFLLREKTHIFSLGYKGYIPHSAFVKKQIDALATGLKVYSLSKAVLKSILIPLPNITEQKRITDILSDMDTEIEILENKLHKARQLKQGLMQQLLTGKIRLTDSSVNETISKTYH